MTLRFDPYEILGITREAGAAQVRAAYRKRARETHPDSQEGSEEAFNRVRDAHDLLMDPARRAHYDATGEVRPSGPNNMRSTAMQAILGAISKIAADAVTQGANIESHDVVALIRANLQSQLENFLQTKPKVEKHLDMLGRIAKRLRRKNPDGEDMLQLLIAKNIEQVALQRDMLDKDIATFRMALDILTGYEFDVIHLIMGASTYGQQHPYFIFTTR